MQLKWWELENGGVGYAHTPYFRYFLTELRKSSEINHFVYRVSSNWLVPKNSLLEKGDLWANRNIPLRLGIS